MRTFGYSASLSPDVTIQIIDHVNRGTDGHLCRCWQVRRIKGGACGTWTGKFASAEEAALQSASPAPGTGSDYGRFQAGTVRCANPTKGRQSQTTQNARSVRSA